MRGRPAARSADQRLDVPRALSSLTGLPLRPATVWTCLKTSADDADFQAPSFPEPALDPELSDPGWIEANARFNISKYSLQLVTERNWWRVRCQKETRALDRLASWAMAMAWTMRTRFGSDELGLSSQEVAQVAWLAPVGLWALAAVDPYLLGQWQACPNLQTRRAWEKQVAGDRLDWLSRQLIDRWQLPPAVRAVSWMFSNPGQYPALQAGSQLEALVSCWNNAREWVDSTSMALHKPRSIGPVPDPAEIKSWMVGLQAANPTSFMAFEPTEREIPLMRSWAKLKSRDKRPFTPVVAAPSLASALFSGVSASDWPTAALEIERALEYFPGIEHASLQRVRTGQANTPQFTEFDRSPDIMVSLPTEADPGFRLALWYSGVQGEPDCTDQILQTLEDVRGWSRWFAEVEQIRSIAQSAMEALEDPEAEVSATSPSLLQALAQFAAGAGHELNNPLAVIMGRAQLLLARLEDPEIQRSLRIIISQCQRAHRMLRDLMYYAQPSAGRPRSCIPEEVIRRGLEDLRPEADSRGLSLQFTLPQAERSTVSSLDPDQLRLTVDALVRNALEVSSPSSSVQVKVQRRGQWLKLEVRDQGRGLRGDEGHLLLNPLYSGRQAGRGLGLGLPRLARMLNEIGGALEWSKNPTGGTRFEARFSLSTSLNEESA